LKPEAERYIVRPSKHIREAIDGSLGISIPDALVLCPGIGARSLGGVEDSNVFPIRGQTVLIRAPWIRNGITCKRTVDGVAEWSYLIPRRNGEAILGGSADPDDWDTNPRPDITSGILQRALQLCPDIVPPHLRKNGPEPTVEDLQPLIVKIGCGLRPGRKGGIRLEADWVENGDKKRVPVVFNYGHGGGGYQTSWASAAAATDLLDKALGNKGQ